MAAPLGLEPRQADPESAVLPLHHRAVDLLLYKMNTVIVCLTACVASGLTLFSGFGLGTLLLPVFALWFPLPSAIALTAVVHLLNTLFKLGLLGRYAEKRIVVAFGMPALVSAWVGAWVLTVLTQVPLVFRYFFLGTERSVTLVKVIVGTLMILFGLAECLPKLKDITFKPRYLPWGGLLSGFFGGLSGHQGAFRSAFLAKSGLSTEQFLGTGIVIAVLIDLARISVYWGRLGAVDLAAHGPILIFATLAAWIGAWIGSRLAKKVTIQTVQAMVAAFLFLIAGGLISGLI